MDDSSRKQLDDRKMDREAWLYVGFIILHGLAFSLAIIAMGRDHIATVIPSKIDGRMICSYKLDLSSLYGVIAIGIMLLCQLSLGVLTKSICCLIEITGGNNDRRCTLLSSIFSLVTFLITEGLLVLGSSSNTAEYSKYFGKNMELDARSCKYLRMGEFGFSSVFVGLTFISSSSLIWSYCRYNTSDGDKLMNVL